MFTSALSASSSEKKMSEEGSPQPVDRTLSIERENSRKMKAEMWERGYKTVKHLSSTVLESVTSQVSDIPSRSE